MYDDIPSCEDVKDVVIPKQILDLFEGAAVEFHPERESQSVEDGVVKLGLLCGPAYTWEALVHEMAHFIEIDEARMNRNAWGFRWPSKDGYPMDFQNSAHIERELRVFAISLHLFEYAGVRVDPNTMTRTLVWMDYWSVYSEVDAIELSDLDLLLKGDTFQKKMTVWGTRKVREYYDNYNIDDLLHEWWRRNKILLDRR